MNRPLWIVKVGSSLVTDGGQGINTAHLSAWAAQMAALRAQGVDVVLVSSGAIAEGLHQLGIRERPKEINRLQAAAAVGQVSLAQAYETAFAAHGIRCAQILLTHDDLKNRTRYLNTRSTLRTLLEMGVLPIINENDTIAVSEIKLGDNDTLGALAANLMVADMLVIMTDQDGLYTADPRKNPDARLIVEISTDAPELESMAGGAGSEVGTGGMFTKVTAARRAALGGTPTRIASGRTENLLPRLLAGESTGTLLIPGETRANARRQWLYGQLHLSGSLTVDAGAAAALRRNSSLLPVGCTDVSGSFHRGEAVAVLDENGHEIARGLANYAGEEIVRILRTPSAHIAEKLGYAAEPELIHRDNLVLQAG